MENLMQRLHPYERRQMGSAADRFSACRPKALTVEGSEIYAEGPILSDDMKLFYGDEGIITPGGVRDALSEIKGDVTIRLNSPGGSVFDASSIATMVQERAARDAVKLIVTGMCASAATYFLFDATETRIARMGMVMIHNAWGITIGDRDDHMTQASLLEKIDTAYADAMAELMESDRESVMAAMSKETWYTAEEAVDAKLVGGLYEPKPETRADKTPRRQLASLISQMRET